MSEYAISPNQVVSTLREIVTEKGSGYVDPFAAISVGCEYIYNPTDIEDVFVSQGHDAPVNETCHCVVGEVFHRLGVADEVLKDMNTVGGIYEVYEGGELEDTELPPVTYPALNLLVAAQLNSDAGSSWGDVLTLIEREYDDLSEDEKVSTDGR